MEQKLKKQFVLNTGFFAKILILGFPGNLGKLSNSSYCKID